MRKNLYHFLTAGFVGFFLPFVVWANDTNILVTCFEGDECNACHLVLMVNNVVQRLVLFLVVLIVLLFSWAGFKLITSGGNQAQFKAAKDMLQTVLIGLMIVLCGWLIVDTLMKAMLTDGEINTSEVSWGVWNEIPDNMCLDQVTLNDGEKTEFAEEEWGKASYASYKTGTASGCVGYYEPHTGTCYTNSANVPDGVTADGTGNVSYATDSASTCVGYYEPHTSTCYSTLYNTSYTTGTASGCVGYYDSAHDTCYTTSDNVPDSPTFVDTAEGPVVEHVDSTPESLSGTIYTVNCNSATGCTADCPNGHTPVGTKMIVNSSTGDTEWLQECRLP